MRGDTGPRVLMQRRIQWADTDGSGLWHFRVACDLVEEAEAELHRRLGIVDQTIGNLPRVNFAVDYVAPAVFGDLLDVHLRVVKVGRTSVVYDFSIQRGDDLLASGSMAGVFMNREGKASEWPRTLRDRLSRQGAVT